MANNDKIHTTIIRHNYCQYHTILQRVIIIINIIYTPDTSYVQCATSEASNSAGSVGFTGIKPHSFIHDKTHQLFKRKCWPAIQKNPVTEPKRTNI